MSNNLIDDMIKSKDLWKHKRFVRYKDGCILYSMSYNQFKKISEEANAVYKYGKLVLVDTRAVDQYLEYFHLDMD